MSAVVQQRFLRSKQEEEIKKGIASEMNSIYHGLSYTDRRICKAYLGFLPIKDVSTPKRKKSEASIFAQEVLWPVQISSDDDITFENRSYDIKEEMLSTGDEIPELFVHDEKSIKEMFAEGRTRKEHEQNILLKSFQVERK